MSLSDASDGYPSHSAHSTRTPIPLVQRMRSSHKSSDMWEPLSATGIPPLSTEEQTGSSSASSVTHQWHQSFIQWKLRTAPQRPKLWHSAETTPFHPFHPHRTQSLHTASVVVVATLHFRGCSPVGLGAGRNRKSGHRTTHHTFSQCTPNHMPAVMPAQGTVHSRELLCAFARGGIGACARDARSDHA